MPAHEETEARLGAEREQTLLRLGQLHEQFTSIVEASAQSNADDEHDPEGATIAFERAQVQALVDQGERRLGEVEAAIARLDDGSYGVCPVCGRDIPEERLEARPTALTCVSCG